jgi:polyisoprenoid-binding protein YceI
MKKLLICLLFLVLSHTPTWAQVYQVDPKESTIQWTGSKLIGKHTGKIALQKGSLTFQKGKLTGGELVVEMKSITDEDLSGELQEKLLTHLKSDDFFGVEKYPTSKFIITQAKEGKKGAWEITGNLTIKEKTVPISFSGRISKPAKALIADAPVEFDRTAFDVRYGSGKFFQNLGDKVINDKVQLQVHLVAKP